jgi:hypothetical protein
MYSVVIRLYQIRDEVRAYAYAYEGEPEKSKTLFAARSVLPLPPDVKLAGHPEMMDASVLVCQELAQKFDLPLF